MRPVTSWGIAWRVVAILVGLFVVLFACTALFAGNGCTDRPGLTDPDVPYENVQFC